MKIIKYMALVALVCSVQAIKSVTVSDLQQQINQGNFTIESIRFVLDSDNDQLVAHLFGLENANLADLPPAQIKAKVAALRVQARANYTALKKLVQQDQELATRLAELYQYFDGNLSQAAEAYSRNQ